LHQNTRPWKQLLFDAHGVRAWKEFRLFACVPSKDLLLVPQLTRFFYFYGPSGGGATTISIDHYEA